MRWYSITWIDIDGNPIKREVLHRSSPYKVWKFIEGRLNKNLLSSDIYGVWFSESLPEETWDEVYDDEREPSAKPDEVPIQPLFER